MKATEQIVGNTTLPIWKVFVVDEHDMQLSTCSAWTTREEAISEAVAIWERAIAYFPIKGHWAEGYKRLRTLNGRWRYLETYLNLRVIRGADPDEEGTRYFAMPERFRACRN